jgi:hypothetical protein
MTHPTSAADWEPVAVPRRYAPSWLWGWIPMRLRGILLIQPLRWMLFRELEK